MINGVRRESILVPQEVGGLKMRMLPVVKSVLHVEIVRDGGSLAATFRDKDGSKWILFLKIDQVVRESSIEILGFKEPVLINADPAKRPMDSESRIYSELSGPVCPLTWEEAEVLVGQISELATTLTERAAGALKQLSMLVDGRGGLPPDMVRSFPTLKL